jgi:hypothetical protein
LSITIGWPSAAPSFVPMIREYVSVLPPGGKGTMKRMGREG